MRVFFQESDHALLTSHNHNITFRLVNKLQLMPLYRSEPAALGFNFNEPYASVGENASNIGVPVSGLPDGFLYVAAFEGEFVDQSALDTVFTPVDGRRFDGAHSFSRFLRLKADVYLSYGFL